MSTISQAHVNAVVASLAAHPASDSDAAVHLLSLARPTGTTARTAAAFLSHCEQAATSNARGVTVSRMAWGLNEAALQAEIAVYAPVRVERWEWARRDSAVGTRR